MLLLRFTKHITSSTNYENKQLPPQKSIVYVNATYRHFPNCRSQKRYKTKSANIDKYFGFIIVFCHFYTLFLVHR